MTEMRVYFRIFYADEWRKLVIRFLHGRVGNNQKSKKLTLFIINIGFLAPPANQRIVFFFYLMLVFSGSHILNQSKIQVFYIEMLLNHFGQ